MACSEARLAANRANAQKSPGPRTDEGKEASRRNALKHGLTGAGVVVHGEDAEAIARQSAAILDELVPDGPPIARLLAERVATLAVRLKRSERHEFAATAARCRVAAEEFDEFRRAEAGRLFEAIGEGSNRDDLLAMPEGVDLLDAALAELRAAAVAAAWSRDASARLVRFLSAEARPHAEALGRALDDGDLSGIDRMLVAIMDRDHVRGPWALDQVVGLVDAEREELASLRSTLDHDGIARLRAEAVALVLVDAAPETLHARKYEAATERSLFRALREIREARNPAAAPSPAPAAPGPQPSSPTPGDMARAAEAARRRLGPIGPADVAAGGVPLGSIFPGAPGASAARHESKVADAEPAPHGRSRYEDRRKRPKLGR